MLPETERATEPNSVQSSFLPTTGEEKNNVFAGAALSILVGLGLIAAPRKKEEKVK